MLSTDFLDVVLSQLPRHHVTQYTALSSSSWLAPCLNDFRNVISNVISDGITMAVNGTGYESPFFVHTLMNPNNKHSYLQGYPHINEQQQVFVKNLFQTQMLEMREQVQLWFAIEWAKWEKANQAHEALLEGEVKLKLWGSSWLMSKYKQVQRQGKIFNYYHSLLADHHWSSEPLAFALNL